MPTHSVIEQGSLFYDSVESQQLENYTEHVWNFDTYSGDHVRLLLQSQQWVPFWDLSGAGVQESLIGAGNVDFWSTGGRVTVNIRERYGGGQYMISLQMLNPPTPIATLVIPTITPTPFATEVIHLGTGDVQVTLRWHTFADLDLHVVDPTNEEIYFANPISASGGELDVDANYGPCAATLAPVENIFWQLGQSPRGHYSVIVHYFPTCGDYGTTDYEVTVNLSGRSPLVFTGTLTGPGDSETAGSFDY